VPLIEGQQPSRPVSVGEYDVRRIGYADVVVRVFAAVHNCDRGGVIGGVPFREFVRLILPRLRDRLGLPPGPAGGSDGAEGAVWPVCHGFSPLVVPRPADWPSGAEVSGYWWPARPEGWQPPPGLVDFLAAGPPPVFIGFGSMAPGQGGQLSQVVADAVTRVGVRAVVQAGWAGLTGTGEQILAVGDVPHDWLFPQVAAVVHHAGAGTAGAGLRAGVPAVPVPVLADQPFWAHRLHDLGVAPEPVYFAKLTAEALSGALRECLGEPGYRERAASLARRIADEDGAAAVLARIERLAASSLRRCPPDLPCTD